MASVATHKKVLIVGGVAGGTSAATRLRRLDEHADIVIFEKGPHVSFASCGLPYYIGSVIPKEEQLLVTTPDALSRKFNIDIRTRQEVVAINREQKTLVVKDLQRQQVYEEPYDYVILSPGAVPIKPTLPNIDLPGIFTVRSVEDASAIVRWTEQTNANRAVVIGGGFIGIEMAENLRRRNMAVTIVEKMPQLLPVLDGEMAMYMLKAAVTAGVKVILNDGVTRFDQAEDGGLKVSLESGSALQADVIILSIGVKPDTALAKAAGLELGIRESIKVDNHMRTSDPYIFAVGDAVQIKNYISHTDSIVPLAGPAQRQGRIAADNVCGIPSTFRGSQGTSICGAFGIAVAITGETEKSLKRAGLHEKVQAVHLHPTHRVSWYPNSKKLHLKVIFDKDTGEILGGQAAGEEGVDKRVDVLAMAIQKHATIDDLAEAELCYAPQYGSAKDPINLAGMIACNSRDGLSPLVDARAVTSIDSNSEFVLLDVRTEAERKNIGSVAGSLNIPLDELRNRLDEVPRNKPIYVMCAVGQRAHVATRILKAYGIDAYLLAGGFTTWETMHKSPL